MSELKIKIGKRTVSDKSLCFVIAEIGHNHQGNINTAFEMIKMAAYCGADAVKFQKRDNRILYTKAMYNKQYDNENSYGSTYGAHREFLEFGWEEYVQLKKCAEDSGIEFMCAPFDFSSVDFLEKLDINSFKFASGDITNIPLLTYAAKFGKPMFLSTGASTIEEIKKAYDAVYKINKNICILHCTCGYPTEYSKLNLRVIESLKKEFPEAIIGYSGHDNGILAPVIAYMLGARVVEKHFTLNHAWKGTDHKFSLEPIGLKKQVRDLKRLVDSLGDGKKSINEFEKDTRAKMGKSLYSSKTIKAGQILTKDDISVKTPSGGLPPYHYESLVGKKAKCDINEEVMLTFDLFE